MGKLKISNISLTPLWVVVSYKFGLCETKLEAGDIETFELPASVIKIDKDREKDLRIDTFQC